MEDWVIVCIYQRRRRSNKCQVKKTRRNEDALVAANCDNFMDFVIHESETGPPLPSSSCSSVTSEHVSINQEETCSSNMY